MAGKERRFYRCKSKVPFEEDAVHEFKGHKSISVEDVPPWTQEPCKETGQRRGTRKSVSRTLNGFLNTGRGGVVYLGVADDGTVLGLPLNQYQKDHIMTSVDDLMTRYVPPVEPHRYKIKFVPVVDENSTEEEIMAAISFTDKVDTERRHRRHVIRTHELCWCEKEMRALLRNDTLVPMYVVEITIKPWDPTNPQCRGVGKLNTHPIHEDEEGSVYFRRQASLVQYTLSEVAAMARQAVEEHYRPKIEKLRQQLHSEHH